MIYNESPVKHSGLMAANVYKKEKKTKQVNEAYRDMLGSQNEMPVRFSMSNDY